MSDHHCRNGRALDDNNSEENVHTEELSLPYYTEDEMRVLVTGNINVNRPEEDEKVNDDEEGAIPVANHSPSEQPKTTSSTFKEEDESPLVLAEGEKELLRSRAAVAQGILVTMGKKPGQQQDEQEVSSNPSSSFVVDKDDKTSKHFDQRIGAIPIPGLDVDEERGMTVASPSSTTTSTWTSLLEQTQSQPMLIEAHVVDNSGARASQDDSDSSQGLGNCEPPTAHSMRALVHVSRAAPMSTQTTTCCEKYKWHTLVLLLVLVILVAGAVTFAVMETGSSSSSSDKVGATSPTPSPTTTASTNAPTLPSFTYLGCFRDSEQRDFTDIGYVRHVQNTQSRCIETCADAGFLYAGLQYGHQCYCGDSFGSYGTTNGASCNIPCPGNSVEMCGGAWANGIFLARRSRPTESIHLGCFADSKPRDLPLQAYSDLDENTPATCIEACASAGYLYAGLQWGQQCYCGNSFGAYGSNNTECDVPCTGNSSYVCGGNWANSIYLV